MVGLLSWAFLGIIGLRFLFWLRGCLDIWEDIWRYFGYGMSGQSVRDPPGEDMSAGIRTRYVL